MFSNNANVWPIRWKSYRYSSQKEVFNEKLTNVKCELSMIYLDRNIQFLSYSLGSGKVHMKKIVCRFVGLCYDQSSKVKGEKY